MTRRARGDRVRISAAVVSMALLVGVMTIRVIGQHERDDSQAVINAVQGDRMVALTDRVSQIEAVDAKTRLKILEAKADDTLNQLTWLTRTNYGVLLALLCNFAATIAQIRLRGKVEPPRDD